MALPVVKLHPNMDTATLVAALNQNFALIENLNRTTIYKDETGTNRIIIGKLPDGTWGMVVSKPGVDVLSVFS